MWYEDLNPDDQVPAGGRPGGPAPGPGRPAGVHLGPQPEGLHRPPAVRRPGPQDVPEDRLPGRRRVPRRLPRDPVRPRAVEGPAPLDPVLRRGAAPKKGEFVVLLCRATTSAA